MADPGEPTKIWMDVRHVERTENVGCQAGSCNTRWAQFVIDVPYNPRTGKWKPSRTYLCKECAQKLLVLSDALGVN